MGCAHQPRVNTLLHAAVRHQNRPFGKTQDYGVSHLFYGYSKLLLRWLLAFTGFDMRR